MQAQYHQISVCKKSKSGLEIFTLIDPVEALIPEYGLLTAIIKRAYMDLSSLDHLQIKDARSWLLNRSAEDWSFLWIADQLNLSDYLIHTLRKAALNTYN